MSVQLHKLTTKITCFQIFFHRANKHRTNLQLLYLQVQLLQYTNVNTHHLQIQFYFSELFSFDFIVRYTTNYLASLYQLPTTIQVT